MTLFPRIATTLVCAALLISCGGGGGGDVETPAPGTPAAATVSVYAGELRSPGSRDGVGAAAQFSNPVDVAQDAAGNVYVADSGNHTIRKITLDATVTTFAGVAGAPGSADGAGANARFNFPTGVAVDASGNVVVSDGGNRTLRRITPAGVVTTIAGVPGAGVIVDGDAATARLGAPGSIAVDAAGSIYFVDGASIRKRAADGSITTFAGNAGERVPQAFGNGAQSRFASTPLSVAVDGSGNVYVAEGSSFPNNNIGNIRKFDSAAQALAFGSSGKGAIGFSYPSDIAADAAGNVYALSNGVDQPSPSFITRYRSLHRITPDGLQVTQLAGGNEIRTVDGPAASSRFSDPRAVAVGPAGRIVVAEGSNTIRLVDTQRGVVSTLAGGSGKGYVDGPAAASRFDAASGIAAGSDGALYVADFQNQLLRKIGTDGIVSTLAPAGFVRNVAVTPNGGDVYALGQETTFGRSIARVSQGSTTLVATIANTSTDALAADAAGNLYVSENSDLKIIPPGGPSRVLVSGVFATALAADAAGNVYFISSLGTVGVVAPSGAAVIRAGSPHERSVVDGQGLDARFGFPIELAVDPAGNMYVADGNRIRKVTPQGLVTTIADVATVQGAQPGFATSVLSVTGLAWSNGALYASTLDAVLRIAPVN